MQLTLRIPDELAAALKRESKRRSQSVNSFATTVLAAAVDPDLAETDAQRLRERLARAGLLDETRAAPHRRPGAERTRAARERAGRGRSLSDFIREGRG